VSGRPEAGQRLRRLLAVLTWLARLQRAPVAELAERFSMSPEELVADLELAACCGLPPYTPDQLMEIVVDDEEVVANLGDELARPRRLTAAEGFALAAAARAILDSAGVGADGAGEALASALAKLEAALASGSGGQHPEGNGDGAHSSSTSGGLQVDLGGAAHLAEVRAAVEGGRQLAVRYYSMSSDEESERVIDPLAVVAMDGRWYLDAYCHRASGIRRFRVDRLVSVAETGEPVDHQRNPLETGTAQTAAFLPGPDATVVTLLVDPEVMWLIEALPVVSLSRSSDGRSEVRLAVASTVWFERLLLRLGPHAEVVAPAELAEVGRAAAARLLDRYRRSTR